MAGSPSKPIELKIDVIGPESILFAGTSAHYSDCIFTALIRHLKKKTNYSLGRLAGRCY